MKPKVVKRKLIGVIDCEPKWVELVSLYCEWLETGVESQKKLARDEIHKMAVVCDLVRSKQKEAEKKGLKKCTIILTVKPLKDGES